MMKIALIFDPAVTEAEAIASIKAHFSGKVHIHGHDLTRDQLKQLNDGQPVSLGSTPAIPQPPVTAITEPAALSNTQLDATGVPWDERIHSSNKEMTEKNVWRKRRGVDPKEFDRITEQLKHTMGAGLPAAIPANVLAAPPAPAAMTAPPLPAAAAPSLPAIPLPPPGPTPEQLAYDELCATIATNLNTPSNPQGRINDDWVNQLIAHFGVIDPATGKGSLLLLQHRPDIVTPVREYLRQSLGA